MIEEKFSPFVNKWGTTNEGKKTLEAIEGLQRNYEKYGESYCPCKVERIRDNICPCKDFRESGKCICGLYKSDQKPSYEM